MEENGICDHSMRITAATKAFSHEAEIVRVLEYLGRANFPTMRSSSGSMTRWHKIKSG